MKTPLKLFIIAYLVIASLCAIFYSNTLHNPFIWDDELLVVKNPLIRNWQSWPRAFINDLYLGSSTGSNFYRPLQTLSNMWDYYFWEMDPLGYHLTNIFLQSIASFLVFVFLYSLTKSLAISFSASLLFSLNPLSSEAVTYVSGRAEMLLGIFLFSSFIIFIKSITDKEKVNIRYLCLSLLLFILGLLSKELAIVFPLVILAFVFYYAKDNLKKRGYFIKVILPFFAVDFIYIILRSTILKFETARLPTLLKYSAGFRISVFPQVFSTYFKLFLFPANLYMSRTVNPPDNSLGVFLSYFLTALILGIFAYILIYKRNKKLCAFLLFWYLVFFLPQSGLFPINAFIAEHFVYLSSISFFLLVAYLLRRYLRKELFIFSIIGLLCYYGTLTFSRNFDWQNPLFFYEKIIKFSPQSFQAHNNLGQHYESIAKFDLAISEYKKALEIMPGLLETHSNLASLYSKMGKIKEAKSEFVILEDIAPKDKAGGIQNNIGNLYEMEGLPEAALNKYKLALTLDPSLKFAHFNIARIYFTRGDLNQAAGEILKSLWEIGLSEARETLYLRIITGYFKSLKNLSTGFAATFYNDLGIRFADEGLLDESIQAFKRSLEAEPRYADACFNLGLAFWKQGLKRKAVYEFKRALKIDPNHSKARGFLSELIYKK